MRGYEVRSWLLMPSVSDAIFAEALASGADAAIIDLSAAPGERARVREWLSAKFSPASRIVVRVGDAIEDDLDAIMPMAPWAILVPCRSGADVQRMGGKLAVREARLGFVDGATRIVASVGDAAAVLNAASFAGASRRLAAIAFDPRSLREDLAAPRAKLAPRLARGLVVLAAAAAGVAAIDGPADPRALRAEAESALREGFSGKIAKTAHEVAVIAAVFADHASASGASA
jgi:citrate lyase subunit beta/citryl-CoA lyase